MKDRGSNPRSSIFQGDSFNHCTRAQYMMVQYPRSGADVSRMCPVHYEFALYPILDEFTLYPIHAVFFFADVSRMCPVHDEFA